MIFVWRMVQSAYNFDRGQIVPDPIERYLAGAQPASAEPSLDEIARDGRGAGLPLVDAEIGALLRVLATASARRGSSRSAPPSATPASGSRGALPPDGMLITMEMRPRRARGGARELRARRPRRPRERHRRRRASGWSQGRGPVRPDLPGRRQASSTRRCSIASSRCCVPAGCSSPTTCCGAARSCPATSPSRRSRPDTRAMQEFNERITTHPALLTTIVPLRDGVAISVKRPER